MIRKLLTLTLAVLLVGLFAAVVFAAVESGDFSPSTTFGTSDTRIFLPKYAESSLAMRPAPM